MGPLLFTGLTCFGGAVAIGLIAAGTSREVDEPANAAAVRGWAVILMAFAQGIAVLGVVIGLLAINSGQTLSGASGIFAAGPAVAGAFVGLGLIVRRAGESTTWVSLLASTLIIGLAVLGVVVAMLSVFIVEAGTGTLIDWPFVLLGLASGASALAIGSTGARSIPKVAAADGPSAKTVQSAELSRILPFEGIAIGCSVVAILLIFVG